MRDNRHDGARGHRRRRSGRRADSPSACGSWASTGAISLLGDELLPPYQRPPLSKKLTERRDGRRAHLHTLRGLLRQERDGPCAGRAGRGDRSRAPRRAVRRRPGVRLRRAACSAPARGRAAWTLPGGDLPGVFYLRTLEDCERIKAAVAPGARAVIIGGGYIGLEIAASLSKLALRCDRARGARARA